MLKLYLVYQKKLAKQDELSSQSTYTLYFLEL